MTHRASDLLKDGSPSLRARIRIRIRCRPVCKPHHELELLPVGQDVERIIEGLIARIIRRCANYVIRLGLFGSLAAGILFRRGRKSFVRDPHLDVVGLAGKDGDRFVLCLPTETRDRAVVATAVRMTRDPEPCPLRGCSLMVCQNLAILDRFNQAEPQHLQRNAERQIARRELRCEIRLSESAVGNGWIVCASAHRPELMHPAVTSAVGLEFESHFTDGSVLLFESGNNVLSSEAMGDQSKLRILRRLSHRIARIGNYESTGPAQNWMGMTYEALVGIMSCAQPIRIGVDLWEHRIQFTWNGGAVCHVGAPIAGRLQLTCAINSLHERRSLVIVHRRAGRGVWTYQRWMGDRNSPLL